MMDEQLNYWGDVFVARGLRRYMRFEAFMLNPALIVQQLDHGDLLPLLARQRVVRDRLDALVDKQHIQVDRRRVRRHTVLRGQVLIEPLKHHAWRH